MVLILIYLSNILLILRVPTLIWVSTRKYLHDLMFKKHIFFKLFSAYDSSVLAPFS